MSARLIVAALACLTVTACAAAAPSRTVTNNPIPVPSRTQLAGSELDSRLLPVSDFPAGAQVDTQDSSDTGAALLTGSQQPAVPRDCQHSGESLQIPPGGLTGGAFQVLYDGTLDTPPSYHERLYGQNVYQFATVLGSTGYFDLIWSTILHCPTVATKNSTATERMKQTISPGPSAAGNPTVLVRQTGMVNDVNVDSVSLFTIDGTDVYQLGETVFGVPLVSQPSSLAALTADLIARVQAYECALSCSAPSGSS